MRADFLVAIAMALLILVVVYSEFREVAIKKLQDKIDDGIELLRSFLSEVEKMELGDLDDESTAVGRSYKDLQRQILTLEDIRFLLRQRSIDDNSFKVMYALHTAYSQRVSLFTAIARSSQKTHSQLGSIVQFVSLTSLTAK